MTFQEAIKYSNQRWKSNLSHESYFSVTLINWNIRQTRY